MALSAIDRAFRSAMRGKKHAAKFAAPVERAKLPMYRSAQRQLIPQQSS